MRLRIGLVLLVLARAASADAHPAPFSYLDASITDAGIEGSLILHVIDIAHDLQISPAERLLDRCETEDARQRIVAVIEPRLRIAVDGRASSFEWTGIEPMPDRQAVRLAFRVAGGRPALRSLPACFPTIRFTRRS